MANILLYKAERGLVLPPAQLILKQHNGKIGTVCICVNPAGNFLYTALMNMHLVPGMLRVWMYLHGVNKKFYSTIPSA